MADWLNWSSLIANIATALGIIGFIVLYLSHQQNQRQFNFTVMLSCIERYQGLLPVIRNDQEDNSRLKKYVDLTSEEFFYFQQEYIPKSVIVEWLDSIIDIFPLYYNNELRPINSDYISYKAIHNDLLLAAYPRLRKTFSLRNKYDTATHDLGNKKYRDIRKGLIKEVASNPSITLRNRHFRSAFLE